MTRRAAPPRPRRQRGAALLTAMVIVTVVTSVAAGMVWQQWKAVQVETAERARSQSYWLLTGALDWARLILQEDMRTSKIDHLGEPWAVPLAEARLSTFLAADKDNTDLDGVEAFLSGRIEDLQARYNLRNLISAEGKKMPEEVKTLERLCALAKTPSGTSDAIVDGMLRSRGATPVDPASAPQAGSESGTLLPPRTVEDLIWFGLTPQTVALLRPFVTLLQPAPLGQGARSTTLNLNTASKEVIVAVLGVDQGSAQRLIQQRQSQPLKDTGDLASVVPQGKDAGTFQGRIGFDSQNFEVTGRLRYENMVIEERSLVVRTAPRNVKTWHRERINTVLGTPDPR